jgi:hypothetical protein
MMPKTGARWLCVLAATLVVAAPAVAQDAYKWKDANGTVHFSQQPPPQAVPTEHMKLSQDGASQVRNDPAQAKPGQADELADANDRQIRHLCEVAKANLDMLQRGGMLTAGDNIESARKMDDGQREQKLKSTQADIARYCHEK